MTAVTARASQIDREVTRWDSEVHTFIDYAQLAELGIPALLRRPTTLMASTGVVIAGFGDHDYFPGYHEYRCCGLLLGPINEARDGEDRCR